MKITIACVGKLKEKYLTAAMDEYIKRLQPLCKLEILSISEEKMPQEPSEAERKQILEKETQRLLDIVPEHSYVILHDKGRPFQRHQPPGGSGGEISGRGRHC